MTTTPPNSNQSNPLGTFTGLIGVLTVFLFFTGWIYRWAYFGFFSLDINSLNFPAQSFLLVTIQVILGDSIRPLWSVLAVLVVVLVVQASLWLLEPLPATPSTKKPQFPLLRLLRRFRLFPLLRTLWWSHRFLQRFHQFLLLRVLRRLTDVFPPLLRRDSVIVAWVLVALFWLARWQGMEDSWRDTVNSTSTRPIVTLVSPNDKLALGATLNDALIKDKDKNPDIPELKNLRIFGDVSKFRDLYNKGINSSDGSKSIVWRLLIESGNWLYLFPALPKRQNDLRPPIVAVHTGDGRVQSVILSPPNP